MTATETEQQTNEVSEEDARALIRRISAVRTKLIALTPFFGHLALNLKPRIATPQDGVDTAGVAPDGTLILGYEFCQSLTDAQLCGLICHEVLHPALFCWQRQGNRRAIVSGPKGQRFSLWNLAHDLSFNPDILELAKNSSTGGETSIELPPDAALDPSFAGQAAEEIYDTLLKQAMKNKKKGGQGSAGTLDNLPGGGHSIGDDIREDLSSTKDGKQAAKGDKSAQRKLDNDWRVNVVAAAQKHEQEKGKGNLPAGIQKIVDELVDPRVDWKDVLSRWIGENGRRQDYTYRRPARRSESVGEYLPSVQRFGCPHVTILWDTSGSMNGREKEILGDVQGICEDLGLTLRVMCCDTQVHSDVDNIEDALEVIPHIKGGGGSDFRPAFKRLEEESYTGVVVSFTDGYIDVPTLKPLTIKAVLWVLDEHDSDPTGGKWGEVLRVNDKDTARN